MASPATAEATKVLVAATLFSVPERMSIAWSEPAASGEPAVLVMAMVSAPPSRAAFAIATMSGLLPDCEMAMLADCASFSLAP